MKKDNPIREYWSRFNDYLTAEHKAQLNPPKGRDELMQAEEILGCQFPVDFRTLYSLADGFSENSFLLRDDYRILPLQEMVSMSQKNQTVITYETASQYQKPESIVRLIFAVTKPENSDISTISLLINKTGGTVEVWFKEGGIHDFEEVIDTELNLGEWLEECLEYYG